MVEAMKDTSPKVGRRALITGAALTAAAVAARAQTQTTPAADTVTTLAEVPLAPAATITVERRDQIALVGLNRPFIQNRLDPPMRVRLAETFYQYEHDPSLRALVLFGHGDNFSRGIDVDASQAAIVAGRRTLTTPQVVDPLGKSLPHRTKPVVVAVHGDTWNLGHEIYLACDIRIAAANTRFGQDENTHGRFPGGGATVRFVREAGWGNAMRYMLTGDHWTAEESFRMGITQQIAPTPEAALAAGIAMATRIAACGPLSIRATLASAHLMIDPVEADALSKLDAEYGALYRTEDFIEGRRAEAEGRPPRYQGK
jgi:enoyl-CoA hydratase/carnithine racemase